MELWKIPFLNPHPWASSHSKTHKQRRKTISSVAEPVYNVGAAPKKFSEQRLECGWNIWFPHLLNSFFRLWGQHAFSNGTFRCGVTQLVQCLKQALWLICIGNPKGRRRMSIHAFKSLSQKQVRLFLSVANTFQLQSFLSLGADSQGIKGRWTPAGCSEESWRSCWNR